MHKLSTEVSLDGLKTTMYGEDDALHVTYEQDAAPIFEAVRQTRLHTDVFRDGMKKDMVHAFHIPAGVYMELKKIGVDVYTAPVKDIVRGLHQIHRYDACRLTDRKFA